MIAPMLGENSVSKEIETSIICKFMYENNVILKIYTLKHKQSFRSPNFSQIFSSSLFTQVHFLSQKNKIK